MDTLSHALWGYGLFGYKRYALIAILFGAMPDLISFGAFMVAGLIDGTYQAGKPALDSLPSWVFDHYAFGHSFVICMPIIALVALWRKGIAFAMLAWPFHIMLDWPFHSKEYFPTQIFWPISDVSFDGIPWSTWYIWWPNVIGIAILLYYRHKQKKKLANATVTRDASLR